MGRYMVWYVWMYGMYYVMVGGMVWYGMVGIRHGQEQKRPRVVVYDHDRGRGELEIRVEGCNGYALSFLCWNLWLIYMLLL